MRGTVSFQLIKDINFSPHLFLAVFLRNRIFTEDKGATLAAVISQVLGELAVGQYVVQYVMTYKETGHLAEKSENVKEAKGHQLSKNGFTHTGPTFLFV